MKKAGFASSLTSKVALNTIVQSISKASVVAMSIVTISMLTRYLGQEGFGEYTTVMTYLGFFGIVVDMGVYLIVVRELAKIETNAQRLVGNVIGLRLLSGVVILGFSPVIAMLFFPYSDRIDWAIAIGAVGFLFIGLNQIVSSVFHINLVMWKLMVGEVVGRFVILGLTYWFIYRHGGLWEFIGANAFGNVVLFGITYLLARRYVSLIPKFEWSQWKPILKETLPLAAVVLLNRVYFSIDTIFLSVFKTQQEVGIYGLPYKVLDILISFPAIFAGLVFPSLARAGMKKFDELTRIFQKAFDFLVMMALPILGGLIMLAKPIIDLLGGSEFGDSIIILKILSVAVVFIFFSTLLSNLVIAVQMQKKLMIVALVSAVVNVVLNIWLIPKYSYFAASGVTVLTEFLVLVITGWFVWRYIKIVPKLNVVPKVLLSVLAMVIVLYFFRNSNVFVATAAGGVVYLGVLYLTGGFSREMIMNVLGKESGK